MHGGAMFNSPGNHIFIVPGQGGLRNDLDRKKQSGRWSVVGGQCITAAHPSMN